ncbi:pyrroline-5-carboxylate reductase [Anderseniella sp. Alg231-50]|uniref:pyrroline-5-carboxylate reductase n=1 Tax=Anderseniella sp. Alg231-50 TaxID=1922226 RepID=UPI000D55D326
MSVTPNLSGRLVLIGAGKMGTAMLQGWLEAGVTGDQVTIFDPAPPPETMTVIAQHSISHNPPIERVGGVEAILVAVKPQMVDEVLPAMAALAKDNPLVVSVVAGKTIAAFRQHFGATTPVIRTIPNTPAAVGRGITAMAASDGVSSAQSELAMALLASLGEVVTVSDEALIDACTAISGSGPAYIFYMTECMTAAALQLGLPADVAEQLARATVAGAGELMRATGTPAGELRENVTSPKGTTHAALQVLMADPDGMKQLMIRATAEAEKRSRELAG